MGKMRIEEILEEVKRGAMSVERAQELLSFTQIDDAMLDNARLHRKGYPETVFGEGKTADQILAIATRLVANKQTVLITRISPEKATPLLAAFPGARHNPTGRTLTIEAPRGTASHDGVAPPAVSGEQPAIPADDGSTPFVAIVAAGTSDLPVVEECFETLRAFQIPARKIVDVGVAGIHRLFARLEEIKKARVIVVIAGMEGALASVIGGLVDRPILAVPTSVGYGASFQGLAPLLTMLNSCASGISVVNIDNGYGAAYCAAQIWRNR
ncbi:MAG: nickel pincer cofactor biosynthesis protein LarB [Bacillota bacterium]|nr:nickel pincer cofactor biosynthesis protein LarB [Bacillota bacterium]